MFIQVCSLSCLEANCAESIAAKFCPNTLHRAHRQQDSLGIHDLHWRNCLNPQKTLGKALTDCENLHNLDRKLVRILRRSQGFPLKDCKLLGPNLSESSGNPFRDFKIAWKPSGLGQQLSEASGTFRHCTLRLQKFQDVDKKLSESSEITQGLCSWMARFV